VGGLEELGTLFVNSFRYKNYISVGKGYRASNKLILLPNLSTNFLKSDASECFGIFSVNLKSMTWGASGGIGSKF
jgi:hypothetical protein